MAAGTDHYLAVIKPLSNMSTAEQLFCQLARTVYETHCQPVATELPVDIKAENKTLNPFTQFGMTMRENGAIDFMVSG